MGPAKFDELSRELLFKMIGARFPDENQKSRKFPNLPNVVSNSLGAHLRTHGERAKTESQQKFHNRS